MGSIAAMENGSKDRYFQSDAKKLTEGWAEQRRTGYPRFFPAFVNESNGAVNTEEGVRRVIYSSQAYDANAKGVEGGIKLLDEENSSKFGISGDKGGTHLWWDNADKGNF